MANLTQKIEGDDTQHMVDVFQEFLQRRGALSASPTPWMAQISVHTNHVPHPALPEWFHAYNDTNGDPAGDYLGTISQMDAAIGKLVDILRESGDLERTMLWFSAGDNGAHTEAGQASGARPSGQLAASNGLSAWRAHMRACRNSRTCWDSRHTFFQWRVCGLLAASQLLALDQALTIAARAHARAHARFSRCGAVSTFAGLRQCKASLFEGGIRVTGFASSYVRQVLS